MSLTIADKRLQRPDPSGSGRAQSLHAVSRALQQVAVALIIVAGLILAWLVATRNWYQPGSKFGYNLGLAGGCMMLALLIYPLRKRFRWLEPAGALRHWFRLHMVFGIGGPCLILFHSTFKVGSFNGRIALYAMLLVAASGIVGRTIYRQIHHGLYGRKATLTEWQERLNAGSNGVRPALVLAGSGGTHLLEYHDYAFYWPHGVAARMWHFLSLGFRGRRALRLARHEARRILRHAAAERGWNDRQLRIHWREVRRLMDSYVDLVCTTARFSAWERLFALWHIVHVPFIYLLFVSSVAHIIAVHMY